DLQRMREGMAEIQQLAIAGLSLVCRHDGGLGTTARDDGPTQGGTVAPDDARSFGLQPSEEVGIVDQAVLGDFRISGQKLPPWQSGENVGICQDQPWLIEG